MLSVGLQLTLITRDLFGQLADALGQHAALGLDRLTTGGELLPLQDQRLVGHDLVLGRQAGELDRRGEPGGATALGVQARPLGQQGEHLARRRPLIGAKIAGGDLDQHLTLGHGLTFGDMDAADHAAFTVLNGLTVARHGDHALGVGARVQSGDRSPAEE